MAAFRKKPCVYIDDRSYKCKEPDGTGLVRSGSLKTTTRSSARKLCGGLLGVNVVHIAQDGRNEHPTPPPPNVEPLVCLLSCYRDKNAESRSFIRL